MKNLEQWMGEYAESHQNRTNKIIHKFCVPIITWSVVVFFWLIPTPQIFQSIPYLNWATIFVAFCLFFYIRLSFIMFAAMAVEMAIIITSLLYAHHQLGATMLLQVNIVIFVIAWIFQFVGHKIEGKKPSFFKDIQFLLIGPLWVLRSFGVDNRS